MHLDYIRHQQQTRKGQAELGGEGRAMCHRSPVDSIEAAGKPFRQRLVLIGLDWRQFRRASLHHFLISNAWTHRQRVARIIACSRQLHEFVINVSLVDTYSETPWTPRMEVTAPNKLSHPPFAKSAFNLVLLPYQRLISQRAGGQVAKIRYWCPCLELCCLIFFEGRRSFADGTHRVLCIRFVHSRSESCQASD